MPTMRTGLILLLAVALVLTSAPSPVAVAAEDGLLDVDASGGNGAVRGSVVDSQRGSARLVVLNDKPYWTTIDLQTLGVQLEPGTLLQGGPFAELGIIPPNGQVSWSARWNPRQPASVFVRTTPYAGQTDAGPLAAGLTVLTIVVTTLGGAKIGDVDKFVATAESVRNAALLVQQMFGDELAELLTVEGMTSGAFGEALLDALSDPTKVEVLREALALLGITVGKEAIESLLTWINVLLMSKLVIELGWTIATGTSSGGILFSSNPAAAPPATTTPPVATAPVPPATAPLTPTGAAGPTGSAADLDATNIRIANPQPGPASNVFRCGDTVRFVGTITNPTAAAIPATISFDTRESGPETVTTDVQQIVAPPGNSDYASQFRIRDDTGSGIVSFQIDFHLSVRGTQATGTAFHATCS